MATRSSFPPQHKALLDVAQGRGDALLGELEGALIRLLARRVAAQVVERGGSGTEAPEENSQ